LLAADTGWTVHHASFVHSGPILHGRNCTMPAELARACLSRCCARVQSSSRYIDRQHRPLSASKATRQRLPHSIDAPAESRLVPFDTRSGPHDDTTKLDTASMTAELRSPMHNIVNLQRSHSPSCIAAAQMECPWWFESDRSW
jgi:hypothetical protein